MLDATTRLVMGRGFHGTSLQDVLAASDAPRGSLYFHFPDGKEQLVLEAIEASIAWATDALRDAFRPGADPADGVRAYFRNLADVVQRSGYTLGCPVAPLVLDAFADSDAIRDRCLAAFAEWEGVIRDGLLAAGVPADPAAALATVILSAEEGALLIARARRDPTPLMATGEALARAVASALPGEDARGLGG